MSTNGQRFTDAFIQPLPRAVMSATVIGTSPLLCDNPQTAGDPQHETEDPLLDHAYLRGVDETGQLLYGFPSIAFKKAMKRAAATHLHGITGTQVSGTVFVLGILSPLRGEPELYRTKARNPEGQLVDAAYALFDTGWEIDLKIQYVRTPKTPWTREGMVNLLFNAGQLCGVGIGRPEKDGSFGMFTVGDSEFINYLASLEGEM